MGRWDVIMTQSFVNFDSRWKKLSNSCPGHLLSRGTSSCNTGRRLCGPQRRSNLWWNWANSDALITASLSIIFQPWRTDFMTEPSWQVRDIVSLSARWHTYNQRIDFCSVVAMFRNTCSCYTQSSFRICIRKEHSSKMVAASLNMFMISEALQVPAVLWWWSVSGKRRSVLSQPVKLFGMSGSVP